MSGRRLSMYVIGGVGVVVATAALVWSGGDATPQTPPSDSPVIAGAEPDPRSRLGVGGKEIDPARRQPREEPPSLQPPEAEPREREQKPSSPVMPPPPLSVVAGADDLAAAEAAQAARPGVLASVDAALASRRDDLRRRCWTGDAGAAVSLPIEVSYSAGGDLQTLRVLDATREAAAVGACVREQPSLVPATIDPPGVRVTVEASLTLP